jgi:hypothetical protein
MADQALVDALEKIRAILDQALAGKPRRARTSKPEAKAPKTKASPALPDHILKLRDSGFFRQPKTADEVHAKLQPTYHCEVNRVGMALLRLFDRRLLRKAPKRVGKRKLVAYVW